MATLFIGGPWDGRWYETDGALEWRVPVRRAPSPYVPVSPQVDTSDTCRIERYQLRVIRGNTKPYYVYAMSHLTGDDVMERLLTHYGSAT